MILPFKRRICLPIRLHTLDSLKTGVGIYGTRILGVIASQAE